MAEFHGTNCWPIDDVSSRHFLLLRHLRWPVAEAEAGKGPWCVRGNRYRQRIRPLADRFRDRLVRTYGEEQGNRVEYVEAFEVSEYGAPLDAEARPRLFPFLPPLPAASSSRLVQEWVDIRDDE